MTPERWQQVDRFWSAALELAPAQRKTFLDDACGDDGELRREIEELLVADEQAQGFLDASLDFKRIGPWRGLPEEPAVGSRLGTYQLLRLLGSGGMSDVYLAAPDSNPGTPDVAVKLCRCAFKSTDVRRRFHNEGKILAGLDHPNVTRLLDSGTSDEGWPFLVMEYVDGVPIDQYSDERCLPIEGRLRLFLDVCAAVAYAHRNGLVHRDVKPANVLVTRAGEVKLLDFGIAKLLDRERFSLDGSGTRTGVRPMTPGYASPEQIRGRTVTSASDVYALGVLLSELLTGAAPHDLEGLRPLEIERIVCEEEAERMSDAVFRGEACDDKVALVRGLSRRRQLVRRLRGPLDDIVAMALDKEPERRYRDAEDLAEDLRCHLRGESVVAPPASLAGRARRWGRRWATPLSEL